ncbi:MAG: RHS repeat-associated core domain-containing protein [Thermoanaerobaculaceae bacterium]|nr:RHS repeat-associated core domain-containing protein [Thermoanaerobaculaceae bacterium]
MVKYLVDGEMRGIVTEEQKTENFREVSAEENLSLRDLPQSASERSSLPFSLNSVSNEDVSSDQTPQAIPEINFSLLTPVVYFYTWDHLGTVRLITNSYFQIVSKHNYEPYGVELPPYNETSNNTHKFTGQERDQSTNYDYMHFRFYASSMGRFLQPDNIIPDITNPQNWNAYTYVKGNPVNFNDPSGHGPNVPSYPAYIPNTHSFGMSWFDQFDSGWLPWARQTAENSWYFGETRSALGYYHNQYLKGLQKKESVTRQTTSSYTPCNLIGEIISYFAKKVASMFSKNPYFSVVSTLLSGADVFTTLFASEVAWSMYEVNETLSWGVLVGVNTEIFSEGAAAWNSVLKAVTGNLDRSLLESEREAIIASSEEIMILKNDLGYSSYERFFEKELIPATKAAINFMEAFEDAWRRRNI